jgi:hypothetical protein
MVGLNQAFEEVVDVLRDLRKVDCRISICDVIASRWTATTRRIPRVEAHRAQLDSATSVGPRPLIVSRTRNRRPHAADTAG